MEAGSFAPEALILSLEEEDQEKLFAFLCGESGEGAGGGDIRSLVPFFLSLLGGRRRGRRRKRARIKEKQRGGGGEEEGEGKESNRRLSFCVSFLFEKRKKKNFPKKEKINSHFFKK